MTALNDLLTTYRNTAQSEREKGDYFEKLIVTYLRHEPTYKDLYSDVWLYSEWATGHPQFGLDAKDVGIDLVAKTRGTNEYCAVQCKFYAENHKISKQDIDSFFTASGQKPFNHRIIVATTNNWTNSARSALKNQQTPVTKIDLHNLENSQIDWSKYKPGKKATLKPKYELRAHQETALEAVIKGLKEADRGKLIMACGTGKTFVSLKIAEKLAGKGKRVLFLVPSLSLLSQTLTEWTQQSETPLHSFAVCSDSTVGKKGNEDKDQDRVEVFVHELGYPATTKADRLEQELSKRHDQNHMSVVFSTYHSIAVINKAQHKHGLADFDLIICDEAHRTTGTTFKKEKDSHFVKVHDTDYIRCTKRLYMTATPRIYADSVKVNANKDDTILYSMDDEKHYGKELHVISFSEAVELELLVDYKVIILTVDEEYICTTFQSMLKDTNNTLTVSDTAKIIGCWKALSKQDNIEELKGDVEPMRKAVAFCQVIEPIKKGKTHKVSSKQISDKFKEVVANYKENEKDKHTLNCEVEHVDGSMNVSEKNKKLNWLKGDAGHDTCRILSNVRCLSEGIDVPALDAVLFLTPRNSQVDVVQSVGRVMRKAEGKKLGYVILPVVIPDGVCPKEALDSNEQYKVVWDVLQALRSHDDTFDGTINKLGLMDHSKKHDKKIEVIAVTHKVQKKTNTSNSDKNDLFDQTDQVSEQINMRFEVEGLRRALYAKVVEKCGNRKHWDEWAIDIAKIADTHITRIKTIVRNPSNINEVETFEAFAKELRDDLNDSITDDEVIEMLAQHLITKPVFDALFKGYSFASQNPVSKTMQKVLDVLNEHALDKEADTLDKFYASVKMRAEGIDNPEGRQKIIVELYDKFFRNAFPKMTERLGIVYTPVEVVDFIIHSINDLLQKEFNQSLGDKGVHIIDPFTGTGTFITRLLQSGLISKEQLPHKFEHEIHANEIVLLAYYIAAINIESVYYNIVGGGYKPFKGICLTDTFQMSETGDVHSVLPENNKGRRGRQKNLKDIQVIMGNPPYSVGQKSENDNNQNVSYPGLDSRIRETYVKKSTATLSKGLYDSYIRAIRWASDRVGDSGVIGFVTNAGFLGNNSADGLRKCLADEFSSIYVFHLRGNARNYEEAKKEGGTIFGTGSRVPIAITLFVKNPKAQQHGQIFWRDIGDYFNREKKLKTISDFKSINGITDAAGWLEIKPNEHGDWINQRDDSFDAFIKIGDKKSTEEKLFDNYSQGVLTSRDAWCYNASKRNLATNITNMISCYNGEVTRFNGAFADLNKKDRVSKVNGFINTDAKKISWSRALKQHLVKNTPLKFNKDCLTPSMYRPYSKQWLYFNRQLNEMVYQIPQIFPDVSVSNLVISLVGQGELKSFSAIMTETLPDYHLQSGQCFPLYLYEKEEPQQTGNTDLFANTDKEPSANGYTRKDAISDAGLAHFQAAYPGETLNKEDMFYYIYGLLHSPQYLERYADNLSKELPRIPCVKTAKDFWAYSKAGRDLAALHVNYETADRYDVTLEGVNDKLSADAYYVTKMKFGKKKENNKKVKDKNGKKVKDKKADDKTTVVYNAHITIKDIPPEAYDYVVNGKSALAWVMERQAVTTDKKTGIVNDANLWATETMDNPKYPLELFQRVITVSIETMKIVNSLPQLDIDFDID